ncbi:hypothetical protein FB451DRAFT_1402678 [Mycena latifolia]|nr:hypothetical protein FB451DRAFT_1402678 [Mycena latifolia]
MCLHKIHHTDGSGTTECPCPRYIPQEAPQPGPRVCRDCEHWESLHPVAEVPKTSGIADIMAWVRPQLDKARPSSQVADEEARKESSAGFKKVSEQHTGRGGATKYQKKSSSKASKAAEKPKSVGNIIFIPDAHLARDDLDADDVKELGVGAAPSITRIQQLKDGGLVFTHENTQEGELEFYESWSAEHIDKNWLAKLAPHIWSYMKRVHEPLEDDSFYWIPLVFTRGSLYEFVKKGAITGSDLETIKTGRGKRLDASTLYFALRYPVPDKIWHNNAWEDPPSDSDFEGPSKKPAKGKGKARKPVSTRRSSRKILAKEDDVRSVIEVESDGDTGPSSSKRNGKTSQHSSPVKIKLEPELAASAKANTLFLDSDSGVDFPEVLLPGTPADVPASSGATTALVVSDLPSASTAPATSMLTTPVTSMSAVPVTGALLTTTSATLLSSTAPPAANTVTSSLAASAVAAPAVTGPSTHPVSIPTGSQPGTPSSIGLFGLAHSLGSSNAPSSRSFSRYPSSSSTAGPSSSTISSSRPSSRRGIDYAAETAAMEDFYKFGNYREHSPKRSFDTAFLESTGFKSPERPSYNPWKRRKSAQ